MPCRAVAAPVAVADEFLEIVEIARRERFIFAAGWYRVDLGVQFKTPSVWVRGF
jgi:hypothetical protein